MEFENQGGETSFSTVVTSGKSMCLDNEEQSVAASQLMDMYAAGDENVPKARKPYTITKQRERWTDEEHKKFLEALKLYGRAWRRIEEHVGSKTAVQIRSHAQKFFSKVVRETNDEVSPVKAIEIPPPRPKRKPTHPYPRKQVHTVNKRVAVSQEVERSPSPNSLILEQENQSPKSVLSAFGSDTLGSSASNHQNDSQSPVSSDGIKKSPRIVTSMEDNKYQSSTSATDEENGSPSTFATSSSTAQEQSSMKLDAASEDDASKAEYLDMVTEAPTVSLKLFGRTVLVTDSHRPSSLPTTMSKPLAAESHYENHDKDKVETVQQLQQNANPMEADVNDWITWPRGNLSMIYQMNENPIPVEVSSVMPMPWWPLQDGSPFPLLPSFKLNPVPVPPPDACHTETFDESDVQEKEASSTGSSTSEPRTSNKSSDVADSNHQEPFPSKNPSQGFVLKPSKRSAFSPPRADPNKCIKGFVPYKRCLAEKEDQTSTIVREERDGQRIRLCL